MAAFNPQIGAPNLSLGLPQQPNYAELLFKGASSIGDALQSNRDYALALSQDKLKKEELAATNQYRKGSLDVQRIGNEIEAGKAGLMIDPSGRVVQDPNLPVGGSLTAAQMLANKNATIDNIANLRKEQRALPSYKKVAESAPVYRSMASAANSNDPVASLNMIYGMAKIFDPDSVVMNGERATIENSQMLPDQVKAEFYRLIGDPNATLSLETRQWMMREAKSRVQEYRRQYDIETAGLADYAKRNGLADGLIIWGPDADLYGPDPFTSPEPDPNIPIVPVSP